MSDVNTDSIERFQLILEKDPNSKVFALLAESYRRMGLMREAIALCERGTLVHPKFAGGQVAFAKTLLDMSRYDDASQRLRIAIDLAPENILAHSLLAETLLRQKKTKEALQAYKMVLFLNPNDQKARKVVQKMESMTADEYEEEIFQVQPSSPLSLESETDSASSDLKALERRISLADAFLFRHDLEKAKQTLELARQEIGSHPEISKRLTLLESKGAEFIEGPTPLDPIPSRKDVVQQKKVALLQKVLQRVTTYSPQ